jgi:hypothetical protein
MISHRRVTRMCQRSATQLGRIAASAGTVVGLLALAIAVQPVEAQQQAAVRVATAVLERYAGEYVYPDGATWVVRRTADTLFHEAAGRRDRYEPLSETLFRLGPVTTAEFVIDQAGGATQILSDGVALEHRLRRKGSPPESPTASPASPGVRVPRSVLQRYVGVYDYIPGQMDRTDLRVIVALRGDTLTRWMIGREQVLVPISATRFSVAGTSLVTEFVVDEAGVTKVMGSGFQQMLARIPPKR